MRKAFKAKYPHRPKVTNGQQECPVKTSGGYARLSTAFLQMLENPIAANQWLNDPETGPILMQVSRIYQMRLDGERVPASSANIAPSSSRAASSSRATSRPLPSPASTSLTTPAQPSSSSVPPASTSLPPLAEPSSQASSSAPRSASKKPTSASGSR